MQYSTLLSVAALVASTNAYQLYYWDGPQCTGERLFISNSQTKTNKCYVGEPWQVRGDTPLIILQPMIPDTNANNAASVTVKPDPQDNDASCAFNLLISGYRTRSMLTSVVVLWFYKPKDCTQNPVLNTVEKNLMSMPLQECIDFEEFGANSWKINGPFPS